MMKEKRSILETNPEILHTSRFENIELEYLVAFLETGETENVPEELVAYMEMMEKIWGMSRRMFEFPNESAIISHLMILYNFKRPKAMQLLKDAMIYYSRESMMPNEVNRQFVKENGVKTFIAALRMAKTSRDFREAFSIILDTAKFLRWDQDPVDENDENFIRQLQIMTTDVSMFGFEKADRKELGTFIDNLPDVPQKMKDLAKQEIDKVPFKIIFSPEANPRKE